MNTQPLSHPALTGEPVTEAHARACAERGHATHTVDGIDTGICPRCGEVKAQTSNELLRHHVSGAIARGEARPIIGQPAVDEPVTINSLAADLGVTPAAAWRACEGWTSTITPTTPLTAGGASLAKSLIAEVA